MANQSTGLYKDGGIDCRGKIKSGIYIKEYRLLSEKYVL